MAGRRLYIFMIHMMVSVLHLYWHLYLHFMHSKQNGCEAWRSKDRAKWAHAQNKLMLIFFSPSL